MDFNISLQDPNGNYLPAESVTVSESINAGWQWTATLSHVPHDYTVLGVPGHSLLDAFLEDALFSLTLTAGGHTLALPPLVAQSYQEDVSGGGTLSGIDLPMYRLTRSNHTLAPVRDTTSADLLLAIAGEINMAGKFLDYATWSFPIGEVEESVRTNLLTHINRICDVAGYEWRSILSSGAEAIQFYPLEFAPTVDPLDPQPDWSGVSRQRSFSDRITQISIVKTSRMTDSVMITPGSAGAIRPTGTFTHAQSTNPDITLWDGDPSSGGTQVGAGGLAYGAGTVTHLRMERDCGTFYLRGNAYVPAGTELAFCVDQDSTLWPARPADAPWTEQWLPTKAYVEARAQTYLWRANRGTHTLSWEGPPCLWLGLGYALTWPGCPDSRVESITHTLGGRQASTSAESAALGSAQW